MLGHELFKLRFLPRAALENHPHRPRGMRGLDDAKILPRARLRSRVALHQHQSGAVDWAEDARGRRARAELTGLADGWLSSQQEQTQQREKKLADTIHGSGIGGETCCKPELPAEIGSLLVPDVRHQTRNPALTHG